MSVSLKPDNFYVSLSCGEIYRPALICYNLVYPTKFTTIPHVLDIIHVSTEIELFDNVIYIACMPLM